MGKMLNDLLLGTWHSDLPQHQKFSFVLRICKNAVTQLNDVMPYIEIDELSDSTFLDWFGEVELNVDRTAQIVETYLTTQLGSQFLLQMLYFYAGTFPDRAAGLR